MLTVTLFAGPEGVTVSGDVCIYKEGLLLGRQIRSIVRNNIDTCHRLRESSFYFTQPQTDEIQFQLLEQRGDAVRKMRGKCPPN